MKKKHHFGRMAAMLTAAALTTGFTPVSANAAGNGSLLVLGDSISTGYSKDGTLIASYADIVNSYYGTEMTNLAVDGATTTDLLSQLNDAGVQQMVSSADIILVTVGGNDIMQPVLNNEFLDATQYDSMQALINAFSAASANDLLFTLKFQRYLDNVLPDAITAGSANIVQIADQLRSLNGNAEIIFQTIYNPMDLDADDTPLASSGSMEALSVNVNNYLEGLENNILYPTGINDAIRSLQNVKVLDTYQTFFDRAFYYTRINDADVHPNSIGHLAIAESLIQLAERAETGNENGTRMRAAYVGSGAEQTLHAVNADMNASIQARALQNSYGDVNADGAVDTTDASQALSIFAASGAGLDAPVTGVNALAADGDMNGTVDISDATLMLNYFSQSAANVFTGTFMEFAAQQ